MPVPVETLPIPPEPTTVLLCGGAFDPPHRAHLALPPLARDVLAADLLLYIPAAAPPLKDGPAAPASHRIAMLAAALEGAPRTAIATIEIERAARSPDPSYTIDTLRAIKRERPRANLRLLIGADQASQFHRWKDAHAVRDLAPPAVMLRPPLDDPHELLASLSDHWTPAQIEQWGGALIDLPPIDASSTRVRHLLADAPDSPELQSLLTPPVLHYIAHNHLYATPPTLP